MKSSLTPPAPSKSGDRAVPLALLVAFVPFALALALILALVMSLGSIFWALPDSKQKIAPAVEITPESQVASVNDATGS